MTVIRFIFGALNSDFEFIILPLLSWILWPSSACLVRLSKNEPVMVNLNITLWPFSGWYSKICLQSGLFFDSFLKSATCSPALTEIFLNVSPSYVNSQSWHWILYPTLWAEHLCLTWVTIWGLLLQNGQLDSLHRRGGKGSFLTRMFFTLMPPFSTIFMFILWPEFNSDSRFFSLFASSPLEWGVQIILKWTVYLHRLRTSTNQKRLYSSLTLLL